MAGLSFDSGRDGARIHPEIEAAGGKENERVRLKKNQVDNLRSQRGRETGQAACEDEKQHERHIAGQEDCSRGECECDPTPGAFKGP